MSSNFRSLRTCSVILLFAAAGFGRFVTAAEESLRLLYSGDRQAEIGPCDCAGPKLGGLDRFANAVIHLKNEGGGKRRALVVDSGDLFFKLPQLPEMEHATALLNAETIADSYALIGVTYFSPGDRDFALGRPTLEKLIAASHLKPLSCNLQDDRGQQLFEPFAIETVGTQKFGFVGISGKEAFARVAGVRVGDELGALKTSVAALKKQGVDRVIVLSHAGLAVDRTLRSVAGVIAVVGGHSADALRNPEGFPKTAVVQTMIQGQEVGKLDWDPSKQEWASHSLVDLDAKWAIPNQVSLRIEMGKKKKIASAIGEREAASDKNKSKASARPFVANAFVCKNCHAEQYAFWEKTKHASAYLVLYSKDQHYDPDCIGCHTLGYQDPRGFKGRAATVVTDEGFRNAKEPFSEKLMKEVFAVDTGKGPLDSRKEPDRYAKLKAKYHEKVTQLAESGKLKALYLGVQCEHCHGNRNGHPQQKVKLSHIDPTTCKQCHDVLHHPQFNFAAMKPQVSCPLLKKK